MIAKIAEVLSNLSHPGSVSTIPRVHINFTYEANDIGAPDAWALKVCLEGIEAIQDDGRVISKVSREWEVQKNTPDACVAEMVKSIKASLQNDLDFKQLEVSTMASAIVYLDSSGKPEDLPTIWPQSKQQAEALELMSQDGNGWAHPADEPQGLGTFKVVSSD